ncbi:MAG: Rieske 2Fe-2S domain-containing protein [Thaumarchaeota archaeon]|nr:Rieske 2Fe-2S domain-containing protein [Nitrososphaerota archaeon]
MVEESTEKPSSQNPPEAEKKPAALQTSPPKPLVAPSPQRPPVQLASPPVPPPASAAKSQPVGSSNRRSFLKGLLVVGAVLSMIPFVPWGSFLSSTITGSGKKYLLQKMVIDDLSKYGTAAGQQVNVNDLSTFPANGHWVVTYPTSGDPKIDADNVDTFQKYELIRLPGAAGSTKSASDFVAFSKVCVHLWCSPNYIPIASSQQYVCPCHGSTYRIPDGKAVAGPAFLQPAPTNAIPMITLQADSSGNLYAYYPNYDPATKKPVGDPLAADGELGYGRDYNSYESFIKPSAQLPADPKDLTTEVA